MPPWGGERPPISPNYWLPDGKNATDCDRGIVLLDAFSPSHGLYLKHRALDTYECGVVDALSPYVVDYLVDKAEGEEEKAEIAQARMPLSLEECGEWEER